MEGVADSNLSRRERQIMEVIFASGEATAAAVQEGIPDAPSYSAVRALLAILVDKGHLKHRKEGRSYVYEPTVSRNRAKKAALRTLLKTFFNGSPEDLVASLLNKKEQNLSDDEIGRIRGMIDEAESK